MSRKANIGAPVHIAAPETGRVAKAVVHAVNKGVTVEKHSKKKGHKPRHPLNPAQFGP